MTLSPRLLASLLALPLLATATTASADAGVDAFASPQIERPYYVAGGGSAAGDAWLYLTAFVEGGAHMGHGLWVHGRLGHGIAGDAEIAGPITEGMVGLEGRRCAGRVCGTIGGDIGLLGGTLESSWGTEHEVSGFVMALRGSVELAVTDQLSLRGGLSGRRFVGATGMEMETNNVSGVGLDAAVLVRF